MKGTKREYSFYEIYDRTHIERHLEDMAQRGWLLDKMGNYGWVYRRIEPKKLHFSVCYYPKASVFDPELSERQLEFSDFCAHTGWVLAATNGQAQAFYNEREDPVPIETDPAVELEAIHKSAKKNVLIGYGASLLLGLLYCGEFLGDLLTDPVSFLARGTSLYALCAALFLLLMGAVELVGYFLWRARAKRAAEQGAFYPTPDHSLFSKVCLALILLDFAGMMLSVVFSGDGLMQWIVGLFLCYIALMIAAVNGTKALLKRKKVSASVNRTATIGVDIALGVLMAALIFAGVNYVVSHDLFRDDGSAAIPLTTEDLTGENLPEEWYWRDVNKHSSFLLTQYELYQAHSTHHESEKEYYELPRMVYTVTDVRTAFLSDFCKDKLLHVYSKPQRNDPEGHFVRDYKSADAAPWGAREAYRLYWHAEGDALAHWLLVYDHRFVEIDLDWEPTAEQMAIVGERLGK